MRTSLCEPILTRWPVDPFQREGFGGCGCRCVSVDSQSWVFVGWIGLVRGLRVSLCESMLTLLRVGRSERLDSAVPTVGV